MSNQATYIRAQARLHHAYFLGLQLMVSANKPPAFIEEWMFKLFRRQHEDKFLSSFEKLGLSYLPDAVACAQYHAIANNIGGVGVEYAYENDQKAWVRFRYPRWMFDGPTICGIPVEASRGFLRGWYAHNGVSLNNPKLGFVCVSEDMTGEFGFCGYFLEHDHELTENTRLRFAKGERPPPFSEAEQPRPPSAQWSEERLEKANRNYAIEYVRNAVVTLGELIERDEAVELASRAARLIGLQYFQQMRGMVGTDDGDLNSATEFMRRMFEGMGDSVEVISPANTESRLRHSELRITKNLSAERQALVLTCWEHLWIGALASFQSIKRIRRLDEGKGVIWVISEEA
ncbi:MAG: hypothetical protein AAF384_13940 [Pseudomonadota bacterium]